MLLKNELKKLYIKQYGLIVLLIVFIVKLLTSADLYKASYSDMSYEQQKYYLEYMQEYGGQLTDEKETAILSLYSEAEAAKQLQSDILDKNRNGDYATPEEFTNAMREIPDIIEKYDAIKLLYSNYERVSADRENLLMLPSGSCLAKHTPASTRKTEKGTARKRQTSYRQLNFKRKVTAWIGSRGRLLFLFILLILRAILRNTASPRVSPEACCGL